jgi:hypothetical protein
MLALEPLSHSHSGSTALCFFAKAAIVCGVSRAGSTAIDTKRASWAWDAAAAAPARACA